MLNDDADETVSQPSVMWPSNKLTTMLVLFFGFVLAFGIATSACVSGFLRHVYKTIRGRKEN